MKKSFAAFCMLTLCSLLIMNVGIAMAAEPGYERISYATQVVPTVDGAWTSPDEWTDGDITILSEDVEFRSTWEFADAVMTRFLVEFFSDNTTDVGDYWQMCIDGDQSGGTAPQTGDFRIDIVGHETLTVYEGDGEGWTEITPDPADIQWNNSISDSPTNSTPHWILELMISKNAGVVQMGILWNFRLAVYDESSTAGVLAWPPTAQDVPDGYGVENYSSEAIPEGFGIAVIVLLSSAAVVVGFYLRKRSRTENYYSTKTGNMGFTP
ncbi:hypothetical protein E2P61_05005 [Candidatus Bathyarchaeota archaeon]|nr:hypothetical protein E2P61_05005 [Candidatus Bathyarchaeota archaeon]